MAAKLGSFRYTFAEKRERLLSYKTYSEIGVEEDGGKLSWRMLGGWFGRAWGKMEQVAFKAWQMGQSDPRKIVFSAKMGLALMLISFLIYLKEPFENSSRYSVWAILTVVVVFEFSIGATLSKGLNRGLGTLSAGGLALGMAELCKMAGDKEELCIIFSIFVIGFSATYMKLYPTMKPYEYGFRVFLLTYCFIMVSGNRTRDFVHTAITRFILIAFGAAVCLVVNTCIYPIWAGEDLHDLVVHNFMDVATSVEGCVNGYVSCFEYQRMPSKMFPQEAAPDDRVCSGYKSAVESTSKEDALVGFAIWEPPHGPYKIFRYPWKSYVEVSCALRHCAFMVMALHGCILSEIQAPMEKRHVFRSELERVGNEGARVLREIGEKVKKMEKLGEVDILYQVHEAAEELQKKIDQKSYLLVHSESWIIGPRSIFNNPQDLLLSMGEDGEARKTLEFKSKSEAVLDLRPIIEAGGAAVGGIPFRPTNLQRDSPLLDSMFKRHTSFDPNLPFRPDTSTEEEPSKTYESASALSLATFASLLIEFGARLQNVVDSFEQLSEKARFREPSAPAEDSGGGIFKGRFFSCFRSK